MAFDELKQKLLFNEPPKDNFNELKMKLEECLVKFDKFDVFKFS